MASPLDNPEGERSSKRRRTSSPALRGGNTSHLYLANEHLPFGRYDVQDTPQISITRGSDSDVSTPRPPLPSPLGATPDAELEDTLMPEAGGTPRSQRSSQADSDDEYLNSRSSPIPVEASEEHTPLVRYKAKLILRGHKRGVSCVKFSPDGKWIASCSADATLKTWSADTGAHQQTFHGHLAGISTLAWAPDSAIIASGSDDKTIRLWCAATGQPPKMANPQDPGGPKILRGPLLGHHNYVYSLAFSPKGNMLVSSSYDEAVHLWDVRSGTLLRSLPAHSDPIGGVDFVHDGTLIVSCASDGLIRVWDTATGQCLRTFFHEDTPAAVSVKFSPNGKYVAAWMLDNCLRLWDYKEGKCVKTYQGHRNVKFSLTGAFGSYGDQPTREVHEEHEDDVDGSDGLGHQGASLGINGDAESRHRMSRPEKRAFITSGSEDGGIMLWDVVSKRMLQQLQGHTAPVIAVDTHPTEASLVSCSLDKTIRVWRQDMK